MFGWLPELKGKQYEFTKEQIDNLIESLHDDEYFFDSLLDCLVEHLEAFGDEYGLQLE